VKRPRLKKGDSVCVRDNPFSTPIVGTVTRVGRWKVRVLFPIRKFAWVDSGCCEKVRS